MVNIAIIEDDEGIRNAIQQFLGRQDGLSCDVGVDSVEQFFFAIKTASVPDVILMDIGLPGMSGIDAIRIVKESHPETDIIMFTVYDDAEKIFDALRAGASGYLTKDTPLEEIKDAVKILHSGGAPMAPQIARKVITYFNPPKKVAHVSPLSLREQEIVVALVDGLSYKMIADRLFISIDTVRFHIRSIYKKLHVHSKSEVVARSLRRQI